MHFLMIFLELMALLLCGWCQVAIQFVETGSIDEAS